MMGMGGESGAARTAAVPWFPVVMSVACIDVKGSVLHYATYVKRERRKSDEGRVEGDEVSRAYRYLGVTR